MRLLRYSDAGPIRYASTAVSTMVARTRRRSVLTRAGFVQLRHAQDLPQCGVRVSRRSRWDFVRVLYCVPDANCIDQVHGPAHIGGRPQRLSRG